MSRANLDEILPKSNAAGDDDDEDEYEDEGEGIVDVPSDKPKIKKKRNQISQRKSPATGESSSDLPPIQPVNAADHATKMPKPIFNIVNNNKSTSNKSSSQTVEVEFINEDVPFHKKTSGKVVIAISVIVGVCILFIAAKFIWDWLQRRKHGEYDAFSATDDEKEEIYVDDDDVKGEENNKDKNDKDNSDDNKEKNKDTNDDKSKGGYGMYGGGKLPPYYYDTNRRSREELDAYAEKTMKSSMPRCKYSNRNSNYSGNGRWNGYNKGKYNKYSNKYNNSYNSKYSNKYSGNSKYNNKNKYNESKVTVKRDKNGRFVKSK